MMSGAGARADRSDRTIGLDDRLRDGRRDGARWRTVRAVVDAPIIARAIVVRRRCGRDRRTHHSSFIIIHHPLQTCGVRDMAPIAGERETRGRTRAR